MKPLIAFIFLLSFHTAISQQLPTKDGKIFYESIDTSSYNKLQLYQKAKLWVVNTFKDSKAALVESLSSLDHTFRKVLININVDNQLFCWSLLHEISGKIKRNL